MYNIALQLYSVRDFCEKNLNDCLSQVSNMGFNAVELYSTFNLEAEELKAKCDHYNLSICSAHVSLNMLNKKNIYDTLKYHKKIGNSVLVIPNINTFSFGYKYLKLINFFFKKNWNPKIKRSLDDWSTAINQINEVYKIVRDEGMELGYHNHQEEFIDLGNNICPWDLLNEYLDPGVFFQLDIGNLYSSGTDIIKTFNSSSHEIRSVHCKPFSKNKEIPVIGSDDIDWVSIAQYLKTYEVIEWYIIETDSLAGNTLQNSSNNLESLLRLIRS